MTGSIKRKRRLAAGARSEAATWLTVREATHRPPRHRSGPTGAFCRNGLPHPVVGTLGKEPSGISGMLREVRLRAAALGLMIAASGSGAEAFVGRGLIAAPFGATPAAMCGYS